MSLCAPSSREAWDLYYVCSWGGTSLGWNAHLKDKRQKKKEVNLTSGVVDPELSRQPAEGVVTGRPVREPEANEVGGSGYSPVKFIFLLLGLGAAVL